MRKSIALCTLLIAILTLFTGCPNNESTSLNSQPSVAVMASAAPISTATPTLKPTSTPTITPTLAPTPTPKPTVKPTSTPAPTKAAVKNTEEKKDTTVYITKTGSKYHRDGCRYLSKSQIAISLSKAQANYSPCSVCRP